VEAALRTHIGSDGVAVYATWLCLHPMLIASLPRRVAAGMQQCLHAGPPSGHDLFTLSRNMHQHASLDVCWCAQEVCTVERQVIAWFEVDSAERFRPFPISIITDDLGEYYIFPPFDHPGLKVCKSEGGNPEGWDGAW